MTQTKLTTKSFRNMRPLLSAQANITCNVKHRTYIQGEYKKVALCNFCWHFSSAKKLLAINGKITTVSAPVSKYFGPCDKPAAQYYQLITGIGTRRAQLRRLV